MNETETTHTDDGDAQNETDNETDFITQLENAQLEREQRIEWLEQAAATIGALQSDLERLASAAGTIEFEAAVTKAMVTAEGETTPEIQVHAIINSIDQFHHTDLPERYNWNRYAMVYDDGDYRLEATAWLDSIVPEAER